MEQRISSRQMVCLLVLYLFGNSALFGVNGTAGRDSWISLLLAGVCAWLVTMLYARLHKLGGGRDFFETLELLFGRWVGRALTVLIIWYALHLAALLMRTLTEFGKTSSIVNPPYYLILILFTFAGVYLLRGGESVLGRWAFLSFVLVLGISVFTFVASIKNMQPLNLFPVLRRPVGEVLRGGAQYLAFPFLECVVFLPLLAQYGKEYNAARIFRWGIIWATGILLSILLCNLMLLGEPMLKQLYFPTYSAAKLINVGSFFTRVEETVSVFMLLSSITKYTVCLLVAAKGLGFLCGNAPASDLAVPAGVMCFALSMAVTSNMADLRGFVEVYPLYAAFFQLLLPAVIWGMAEYRRVRPSGPLPAGKKAE